MAVFSVFVGPWSQQHVRASTTISLMMFLFALDLLGMGLALAGHQPSITVLGIHTTVKGILIVSIIVAGASIAPWLSSELAVWYNPVVPFYVAAAVGFGMLVQFSGANMWLGSITWLTTIIHRRVSGQWTETERL